MISFEDHPYENFRRVYYGGNENGEEGWCFVPVCPKCGRFVKADSECYVHHDEIPNATCKKCGRVRMPDEGCF